MKWNSPCCGTSKGAGDCKSVLMEFLFQDFQGVPRVQGCKWAFEHDLYSDSRPETFAFLGWFGGLWCYSPCYSPVWERSGAAEDMFFRCFGDPLQPGAYWWTLAGLIRLKCCLVGHQLKTMESQSDGFKESRFLSNWCDSMCNLHLYPFVIMYGEAKRVTHKSTTKTQICPE